MVRYFLRSFAAEIHCEFMAFLGEMIPQDVSHITTKGVLHLQGLPFKLETLGRVATLVPGPCHGLTFGDVFFDSCSTIACRVERNTPKVFAVRFLFFFFGLKPFLDHKNWHHIRKWCASETDHFLSRNVKIFTLSPQKPQPENSRRTCYTEKKQITTNQCGPNRCECFRPFSSNLGGQQKTTLPAMTGPTQRPTPDFLQKMVHLNFFHIFIGTKDQLTLDLGCLAVSWGVGRHRSWMGWVCVVWYPAICRNPMPIRQAGKWFTKKNDGKILRYKSWAF